MSQNYCQCPNWPVQARPCHVLVIMSSQVFHTLTVSKMLIKLYIFLNSILHMKILGTKSYLTRGQEKIIIVKKFLLSVKFSRVGSGLTKIISVWSDRSIDLIVETVPPLCQILVPETIDISSYQIITLDCLLSALFTCSCREINQFTAMITGGSGSDIKKS